MRLFTWAGRGVCAFFLTLLLMAAANIVLHRGSITRESLGIDRHFDEENCRDTLPLFKPPGNMVSEAVADDYFKYALISLNAYNYEYNQEFTFDRLQEISKRAGGRTLYERVEKSERDGLNYIVYKTTSGHTEVIVGIRGTIPTSTKDWMSNLSWFTGVIPYENYYEIARNILIDIRKRVNDDRANYVVVGHSLGGGLAQHLAAGFPCTSPVVFDTSFVTNEFLYEKPFTQYRSVHIFEREDELTKLRAFLLGAERDGVGFRWYPLNLIDCDPPECANSNKMSLLSRTSRYLCKNFQHSIKDITVAMSRIVAVCQINEPKGCGENVSVETNLQELYCETYGKKDELCDKRRH